MKRKKTPHSVSAQDWEAALCGAHGELKKYKLQPSVQEVWNSLPQKTTEYVKELVRNSALYNETKLLWQGKYQAETSELWNTAYKKYSTRSPNATGKCDISNADGTKRYSMKKHSGSTQLSSPQKAEAATLLHVAVDYALGKKKEQVSSTLQVVIEGMTDSKYYYGTVQSAVKALLPWYNSLPQELTPLLPQRGISSANFKELYPLLKKEAKKQTKSVVNKVLSIFVQKEKHKKATSALNELFNNRDVKEAFLYELLSGRSKFSDISATATHLLTFSPKSNSLTVEEVHSAVRNNVDYVSFELSFRPSSKLVTLLRVYLGRNKSNKLYDHFVGQTNATEYLTEVYTKKLVKTLLQEGTVSDAVNYVVNNPLVIKLSEHFSKLTTKLSELLRSLLLELVNAGKNYVTKLCSVFGLSLDYSKSDYNVPKDYVGYL